ncbi:hypothetical protein MRB53_018764 [Persea americana]|uniref:Uncharacterized protein n=1 Tax=Persea americana TaxID=3435 RepID=A0ACC2M8T9_PERAE|nr:hypothetical protein MRB53_018764 [Persea americana]
MVVVRIAIQAEVEVAIGVMGWNLVKVKIKFSQASHEHKEIARAQVGMEPEIARVSKVFLQTDRGIRT